jgi:hypothetical protein
MQAKHARGHDDSERRKRAVGILVTGDLGSEGSFERRLKRAEVKFARLGHN